MRKPERLDKFYETFKEIHKNPFCDWRFSQLILNFFSWLQNKTKTDGFYIEEDKIIELFKEYANGTSLWYRKN